MQLGNLFHHCGSTELRSSISVHLVCGAGTTRSITLAHKQVNDDMDESVR